MKALKEELIVIDLAPCSAELQHYLQILDDELKKLNQQERKAIYLRFWVPCTIAQVATELRVSWDVAAHIIDNSIHKLRSGIREHKNYKKTLISEEA